MNEQVTPAVPMTLLGGNDAAVCGPDGCELPTVTSVHGSTSTASEAVIEEPVRGEFVHEESVHEETLTADVAFGGAASFADAESREILNLLGGGTPQADGCCGGACCS